MSQAVANLVASAAHLFFFMLMGSARKSALMSWTTFFSRRVISGPHRRPATPPGVNDETALALMVFIIDSPAMTPPIENSPNRPVGSILSAGSAPPYRYLWSVTG